MFVSIFNFWMCPLDGILPSLPQNEKNFSPTQSPSTVAAKQEALSEKMITYEN